MIDHFPRHQQHLCGVHQGGGLVCGAYYRSYVSSVGHCRDMYNDRGRSQPPLLFFDRRRLSRSYAPPSSFTVSNTVSMISQE